MPMIALLSDIHGNLPALEAVVRDVEDRAPDAVYVLGDMVNGCPWPAEVLDRLVGLGWPMLIGNHDDAVLQLDTPRMEPRYANRSLYATLWWTREHLAPMHLALLEHLPSAYPLAFVDALPLRLIHGIPGNFFVGFRPDAPDDWAMRKLEGVSEGTVAAGHTHVPMTRHFGPWLVVNAGSVGAPYDGDVRASYVLLRGERTAWQAEIRRIPYDLDAVDRGYHRSRLDTDGGTLGQMFRRSVLTGLPWVADFAWWIREQPHLALDNAEEALRRYDAEHGPGHWAFPYAKRDR